MSIIPGKTILVIGDENSTVHAVEDALKTAGATLINGRCDSTTADSVDTNVVDLVLLNHLHDGSHCLPFLYTLRTTRLAQMLPILALVDEDHISIEHALALGAADYFTLQESVPHILLKVRSALGESLSTADLSVLDISEIPHTPTVHNIRILVIEDDPLLINLLGMRMDRAGFVFEINQTGLDVATSVTTFAPNMVLLDLSLPDKSGVAVLQEIRADTNNATLPVIIFSNRDSDEDRQAVQALGISRFYVKAMTDLSTLMRDIEELVALSPKR